MDWENQLEKNPIQKIEKTVKIRVKLPHVNKKLLPRNRIFVQTPFSHSTFKLERKNSRRKTTRFFAPFPVSADQNHYSNLTSKIMKMCEQILKKNIAGRKKTASNMDEKYRKHWGTSYEPQSKTQRVV